MHTDFGGHDRINGRNVPYGIPITYVDSRKTPLVQVCVHECDKETACVYVRVHGPVPIQPAATPLVPALHKV